MSDPVAYVSTWRIRPDKFEDYRRFYAELVRVVDANEPRMSAFIAFADEGLTEFTTVHVHPDGASLDHHMDVIGSHMGVLPDDLTAVMQFMEPVQIVVLGQPSGAAAAMDQGLKDSGVPFVTKARYLGGFTRSSA